MGLVQREIEAAGISTITISNIPDLTESVSVPRLAGIEFPVGRPFGNAVDREQQRQVLSAVLHSLQSMNKPGEVTYLPTEWEGDKSESDHPKPELPPIAKYLATHPWMLPKLFKREIPGK